MPPRLVQGEIHLWRAFLDPIAADAPRAVKLLSADERGRALRLVRELDRDRFIMGRAILRTLLAGYLGVGSGEVGLEPGPFGKPCLVRPHSLLFNVSHSNGLALYAFSTDVEIGIDVEWIRPLDTEAVARHCFAPAEAAALASCCAGGRLEALFRWWTRKEACLKAVGCGLSEPLDRLQVSLLPGDPARVVHCHPDFGAADDWRIETPTPAAGYVAAVAWKGRPLALHRFTWSSSQWTGPACVGPQPSTENSTDPIPSHKLGGDGAATLMGTAVEGPS